MNTYLASLRLPSEVPIGVAQNPMTLTAFLSEMLQVNRALLKEVRELNARIETLENVP